MKKLTYNLIIFILIILVISIIHLFLVTKWLDKTQAWANHNTESITLSMVDNMDYDLVLLGTSHGRNFSRHQNHGRVEKLLDKKIFNLSRGGGGGLIPANIYLSYFYKKGNQTEEIIYFVDPFIFYSPTFNEKISYEAEKFDLDFLVKLYENNTSLKELILYAKAKFEPYWFFKKPFSAEADNEFLMEINKESVKKRIDNLYPDGRDDMVFKTYSKVLDELIEQAQSKNSKISLVIPPTLLGDYPGIKELREELLIKKNKYKINVMDYSSSIMDPKLFSDHDHLNTEGVEFFTKKYLINL